MPGGGQFSNICAWPAPTKDAHRITWTHDVGIEARDVGIEARDVGIEARDVGVEARDVGIDR